MYRDPADQTPVTADLWQKFVRESITFHPSGSHIVIRQPVSSDPSDRPKFILDRSHICAKV